MAGIDFIINYSINSTKAKVFSYPRIHQFYLGLKALVWGLPAFTHLPNQVAERNQVKVRRSNIVEPRINLLIMTLNPRKAYGGDSTAIKFFEKISPYYKNIRLICHDEPTVETLAAFPGYRLVSLENDLNEPKQIVSVANSCGRTLAVGSEDIFVATHWLTAYFAQQLVSWQKQEFNQQPKPIVYLIQDYEPGFYAWGSDYLLVRSTYEYKDPVIAVFNSNLLRQYFHKQNYHFDHEYSFEPKMNEVLRNMRTNLEIMKKRKQILVYGRPSAQRNAFSLIVEGLRIWRRRFPLASTWTVISAGQPHPDVDLGDDVAMTSSGKLSLENYARILSESSVGLSLMVSPHPSYPPLEMAHYGMWVLTNNYDNKDISSWHDNIVSISNCSPESIADNLIVLCQRVEAEPMSGWEGNSHIPHYLSDAPPFPFIEEVYQLLQRTACFQR